MIEKLADAYSLAKDQFARDGIALELTMPESSGGKVAARIDATSTRGFGQLIVWTTGEAELVIADVSSGRIAIDEHREITSEIGMKDAMQTLYAHLVES